MRDRGQETRGSSSSSFCFLPDPTCLYRRLLSLAHPILCRLASPLFFSPQRPPEPRKRRKGEREKEKKRRKSKSLGISLLFSASLVFHLPGSFLSLFLVVTEPTQHVNRPKPIYSINVKDVCQFFFIKKDPEKKKTPSAATKESRKKILRSKNYYMAPRESRKPYRPEWLHHRPMPFSCCSPFLLSLVRVVVVVVVVRDLVFIPYNPLCPGALVCNTNSFKIASRVIKEDQKKKMVLWGRICINSLTLFLQHCTNWYARQIFLFSLHIQFVVFFYSSGIGGKTKGLREEFFEWTKKKKKRQKNWRRMKIKSK